MRVLGVVLIAVGLIALVVQGITYTRERTVLDIGPVEAKVEEERRIPLPPIVGILAIAGGIVILLTARPARAV